MLGLVDDGVAGAAVNGVVLGAAGLVAERLAGGLVVVGLDTTESKVSNSSELPLSSIVKHTERSCHQCR